MKKIICLLIMLSMLSVTLFSMTSCVLNDDKVLPMSISQEDWNKYRKYVDLSTGIKMSYVEMGNPNGEVVVLQHGMTDNSRSWSLSASFFCEAGYHVYLPDLRGMGKTTAPDGFYSPITYATDLEAFFDEMKIDKAICIGHSLGSSTMQAFSIMFPERCEKLVLVSAAPLKGYQNDSLAYMYTYIVSPLGEDDHFSDAFMDFWYATDLKEEEFNDVFDTFLGYMKQEAQALSIKAWKNIVVGLTSVDLTEMYKLIDPSIPVLVLHGSLDDMAKGIYQPELLEIFNVDENSYIDYIGVGHNIQFEMPHQCADDIIHWLKIGSVK